MIKAVTKLKPGDKAESLIRRLSRSTSIEP
jgi:hypothetical protein